MSEGNGNVMVPPATFRCNKKKMILVVRIALHHVNPKQINLNTRKDHLELTTSGRRKYHLNKKYPREIEVDDSRTVARMEGNTLHIEMPVRSPPQRTREPPLPSTRLKEPDCRQGLSQHTHARAHNSPSSILGLGGDAAVEFCFALSSRRPSVAASPSQITQLSTIRPHASAAEAAAEAAAAFAPDAGEAKSGGSQKDASEKEVKKGAKKKRPAAEETESVPSKKAPVGAPSKKKPKRGEANGDSGGVQGDAAEPLQKAAKKAKGGGGVERAGKDGGTVKGGGQVKGGGKVKAKGDGVSADSSRILEILDEATEQVCRHTKV